MTALRALRLAPVALAVLSALTAAAPPQAPAPPSQASSGKFPPGQLRLAYGADATRVVVAWATSNLTSRDYSPEVQYGPSPALPLPSSSGGTSDSYVAWNITSPSLHFANLTGLTPGGTPVYYRVGCDAYGWSPVYAFNSSLARGAWPSAAPLTVAVTGDMGVEHSSATMGTLARLAAGGGVTFSIHNGDAAYADDRQSMADGSWADGILDDFYTGLSEAYATSIPVMFGVGNHEMQLGDVPTCINGTAQCKGLAYVKRIGPTLPYAASRSSSPFWYSYDVGPVHFLSLSMEQAWVADGEQHAWVAADISGVDRAVTPWVVAYVHRPIYCSNNMSWPEWDTFRATYEPLFVGGVGGAAGGPPAVDVVLQAHVHCYERLWQVASNGTFVAQTYTGMSTPFYLLSGSAGCMEGSTPWLHTTPAWSAFRACEDVAYGFATLTFANATHMRSALVSAADGREVDAAWVVRQGV